LFTGILFPAIIHKYDLSLGTQIQLLSFVPAFFVLCHFLIKRKYQRDFDRLSYLSAVVCVAMCAGVGAFSQSEMIELGFKVVFLLMRLSNSYSTFGACCLLLPVVLRKLFGKD
ncbi:hypothetical protein P2F01_14500, partial [Mannheimia haemolytica]|nr:hypothetical protein [Mannheimia haemolytica]